MEVRVVLREDLAHAVAPAERVVERDAALREERRHAAGGPPRGRSVQLLDTGDRPAVVEVVSVLVEQHACGAVVAPGRDRDRRGAPPCAPAGGGSAAAVDENLLPRDDP